MTPVALPPPIWACSFELEARPKAWARARTRNGIQFEARDQKEHKATLIALAAPHAPERPHDGPVTVGLECRLPIATSWPKWEQEAAEAGMLFPTGAPDVDNLAKMVLDALTRSGRWWTDDARVIGFHCGPWKVYSRTPGTSVEVCFYRELGAAAEWKSMRLKAHDAR